MFEPVVYAVSDNIISSLGFSTHENLEAIKANRHGFELVNNTNFYPSPFLAARINKQQLADETEAYHSQGYTVFESLLLLSVTKALKDAGLHTDYKDTLLVFSTTKGDIEAIQGVATPPLQANAWHTAQRVADYLGVKDAPMVISNACISGVLAIETAARLLRSGKYKRAIVMAADRVSAFVVSGFQSFKSLSSEPCKPFDESRDGLSLGEAAACLILSTDKADVKYSQPVIVSGGASANDANHISGPSRTGDGLYYAIEKAIKQSGLVNDDIDFVNLHGTGTPYNDEMEAKALALSSLNTKPINGLKGYLGHTLGVSGLLESILCIHSLLEQTIWGTKGFSKAAFPVETPNIVAKHKKEKLTHCLKTAAGFGGSNAAIVFSLQENVKEASAGSSYKTLATCSINNGKIVCNGKLVFETAENQNSPELFLKEAFKSLEQSYMKFYKMDNLCKLGVLAVEYLLQNNTEFLNKYQPNEMAVVLANSAASLDTDLIHQHSIENPEEYFPSPAVFVYTLPNIVIGEICIKHKLQGENVFFLLPESNKELIKQYLPVFFTSPNTKVIIYGWVDYLQGNYAASLFLVEKE